MIARSAQHESTNRRPLLVIAIVFLLGLMCLPAAVASDLPNEQLCSKLALLDANGLPPFCEEEEPLPVQAFPLSAERSVLIDDVAMTIDVTVGERDPLTLDIDDPSRVTVAEIVIQPGAAFPWHTHPGPVLAGVDSGEGGLVYVYADDCVHRHYEAGTMFVDPGGDNIHTAYNPSDTEVTTVVATFLNVPGPDSDGNPAPLTIPVSPDVGDALDAECDIER